MEVVEGYQTVTLEQAKKREETLYAVDSKGNIKSCTRKYSNKFYKDKDTWIDIDELPDDALYIGDYILKA